MITRRHSRRFILIFERDIRIMRIVSSCSRLRTSLTVKVLIVLSVSHLLRRHRQHERDQEVRIMNVTRNIGIRRIHNIVAQTRDRLRRMNRILVSVPRIILQQRLHNTVTCRLNVVIAKIRRSNLNEGAVSTDAPHLLRMYLGEPKTIGVCSCPRIKLISTRTRNVHHRRRPRLITVPRYRILVAIRVVRPYIMYHNNGTVLTRRVNSVYYNTTATSMCCHQTVIVRRVTRRINVPIRQLLRSVNRILPNRTRASSVTVTRLRQLASISSRLLHYYNNRNRSERL